MSLARCRLSRYVRIASNHGQRFEKTQFIWSQLECVMQDESQKGAGSGEIPMRPFGKTGVKESALGVGGHPLGEFAEVEDAIRLVHEAIDAGLTFFDNCWEYFDGRTENWL